MPDHASTVSTNAGKSDRSFAASVYPKAISSSVRKNSPIGVTSWGPDRIDVFGLGTDDAMYHQAWDGVAWSEWVPRGGKFHSP